MKKNPLIWLLIVAVSTLCYSDTNVHVVRNPGCVAPCTNETLYIYDVIARSEKGFVHFVLPGNHLPKAPISVLMFEADSGKEIQVNWTKFLNGTVEEFHNSIHLNGKGNGYGFILNELCEYADVGDTAMISELEINNDCNNMLGKNLIFNLSLLRTSKAVTFKYTANSSSDPNDQLSNGAQISFSITIPKNDEGTLGFKEFSLNPGRGLHFEVNAVNLTPLKPQMRLAPIFLLFSELPLENDEDFVDNLQEDNNAEPKLPTIFLNKWHKIKRYGYTDAQIAVNEGLHSKGSALKSPTPGFIQLKPVCYVEPSETIATTRAVYLAKRILIPKKFAKRYQFALPYALYGERFNRKHQPIVKEQVAIRLQALSLGSPKDGFYQKTRYVSWSGILSVDSPVAGGNYTLASIIAVTVTLCVFIALFPIFVYGAHLYKRRVQHWHALEDDASDNTSEGNAQNDRAPILDSNDNTGHRIMHNIGFLLPYAGRLRICRKIPSPDISRNVITEETDSLI